MVEIMDGSGIQGSIMHYVIFFTLLGSSLLIFIYLWVNDKLDMDESPKIEMMRESEEEGGQ